MEWKYFNPQISRSPVPVSILGRQMQWLLELGINLRIHFRILLRSYSLCGHHAIGKKKAFVQFVNPIRADLEHAIRKYQNSFGIDAVFEWMASNLTRRIANSVAQTHESMHQTTALVRETLAGNECYFCDTLYVQTECKGTSPS